MASLDYLRTYIKPAVSTFGTSKETSMAMRSTISAGRGVYGNARSVRRSRVARFSSKTGECLAHRTGTAAHRSSFYRAYLKSTAWKQKRAMKIASVGGRCERCPGSKKLHCHHRTYKRLGCETMEDLQILCETCHDRVEALKRRGRRERGFTAESHKLSRVGSIPIPATNPPLLWNWA